VQQPECDPRHERDDRRGGASLRSRRDHQQAREPARGRGRVVERFGTVSRIMFKRALQNEISDTDQLVINNNPQIKRVMNNLALNADEALYSMSDYTMRSTAFIQDHESGPQHARGEDRIEEHAPRRVRVCDRDEAHERNVLRTRRLANGQEHALQ
jgi:hypothetical protein